MPSMKRGYHKNREVADAKSNRAPSHGHTADLMHRKVLLESAGVHGGYPNRVLCASCLSDAAGYDTTPHVGWG